MENPCRDLCKAIRLQLNVSEEVGECWIILEYSTACNSAPLLECPGMFCSPDCPEIAQGYKYCTENWTCLSNFLSPTMSPSSSENSDSETEVNPVEPPAPTPLSELQVALAAMHKQQADLAEKATELAKQELQVKSLMQATEKVKADEAKRVRQEWRKQKKVGEGDAKSQMDGMEEMRLSGQKAPEKDKVVP